MILDADTIREINNGLKTSLDFSKQGLSMEEVHTLAGLLRQNNTITHLDLEGCNLGDNKVAVIAAALRGNVTLNSLNLGNNNITEAGIEPLALALISNKTLGALDLNKNNIGSAGITLLSSFLSTNKNLTRLNLSHTLLDDNAAISLSKTLCSNPVLSSLNISNNLITALGMKQLVNKMFHSGNCPITRFDMSTNSVIPSEVGIIDGLIKQSAVPNLLHVNPASEALKKLCSDNEAKALEYAVKLHNATIRLTSDDCVQLRELMSSVIVVSLSQLNISNRDLAKNLLRAVDAANGNNIKLHVPVYWVNMAKPPAAAALAKPLDLPEVLTLHDARQPHRTGVMQMARITSAPPLYYDAIKAGQFTYMIHLLDQQGQKLEAADYTYRPSDKEPSAIEVLCVQEKLTEVFTIENWKGNPRGMHQVASRVPRKELDRQLDGREGRMTYAQLLAMVNASVVKGFRVNEGRVLA